MKIKLFEEYYDSKGNIYKDWEPVTNKFGALDLVYIHPELEQVIPKLKDIREQLQSIQDDLEKIGPVDEDIQDSIESLDKVFKKWENSPFGKEIKKFNL